MQICNDSYHLIGRIQLLPRVMIFVALTEGFGIYRIDVRLWNEGVEGGLVPTAKGFTLTLDQIRGFARLIAEAERMATEDGEWVELEEEPET